MLSGYGGTALAYGQWSLVARFRATPDVGEVAAFEQTARETLF